MKGSIKTLAEPEADRFHRRWVLRNVVTAAPFVALLALPGFVVLGGWERFSFWGFGAVLVGTMTASVISRIALGKCPACKMPLEGISTPSVCKDCRTLLRPASPEGWETLQRLARPAVALSPAELEEFAGERRRRWLWIGAIIGVVITALVASEYVP